MNTFFAVIALFLLGTTVAGLIRISFGPTAADRMLAAQLLGTSGVAILLLLSEAMNEPALRNVALVFVLLAVLTVVAFVERPSAKREDDQLEP